MQRGGFSKEQFRFYALTRYKLGINPSDCYQELRTVHLTASPSKRSVYNWYEKFKIGDIAPSLKDKPKSGRPRTTKLYGNGTMPDLMSPDLCRTT